MMCGRLAHLTHHKALVRRHNIFGRGGGLDQARQFERKRRAALNQDLGPLSSC